MRSSLRIAVLGLGYVGLPLSLELSKHFRVVGYDINKNKINLLKKSKDLNKEYSSTELKKFSNIIFTSHKNDISQSNVYIVALPTPIKKNKSPNTKFLVSACELIGTLVKKEDLVVFESTVFPGLTEEICIPIIEKISKKKLHIDFNVGYSPERINPGDKKNNIQNITKVISASNNKSLQIMKKIYSKICKKVYSAESIKIAEGAKIIENIQRDINIALINELSIAFDKLEIDFNKVLKAASTKWNFQNYTTGLVGGHCIGVDPYYLSHKLNSIGYRTNLILAGRKVNDEYSKFISSKIKKFLRKNKVKLKNIKVIIFGFSFKENVSDIRNTKVFDLYLELKKFIKTVDIYDPIICQKTAREEYGLEIKGNIQSKYNLCVYAVPHNVFSSFNYRLLKSVIKKDGAIFDVKNAIPNNINLKRII